MFGSVGMGKNRDLCRDSHRIHVWYINIYIYIYIWLILMVNVGKYTSPMDPMGLETKKHPVQPKKVTVYLSSVRNQFRNLFTSTTSMKHPTPTHQ